MKLTNEEQEILDSVENGEWKQVPNAAQESVRYRESAKATLRKDKRVNIRITERDLVHFQKAAVHEGLPYQTFISSILHKYINGRLVETTTVSQNLERTESTRSAHLNANRMNM